MLEMIDLDKRFPAEEYRQRKEELVRRLVKCQQTCVAEKIPVVVCVDGLSASGKGSTLSKLVKDLDPRYFHVWPMGEPDFGPQRQHYLTRYWKRIGQYGTLTFFDHSWYGEACIRSVKQSFSWQMRSAMVMEKALVADGYLVIKCFFHVSESKQRKRLKRLAADETTSWRVSKRDFVENADYDRYLEHIDAFLNMTGTSEAKWHLIPADSLKVARIEFMEALADDMEHAIAVRAAKKAPAPSDADGQGAVARPLPVSRYNLVPMPHVTDIATDLVMDEEEYRTRLKAEQKRLSRFADELYLRKIPMMLVFEGWDAAGKGGSIKRVAACLDARDYRVVTSAAPTVVEKEHPFLWRYWVNLPKTGHTAIYDRSWYGRVMVERIEGFCSEDDWRRAYEEINDFEWDMKQAGVLMLKFWVNISPDEQLKRFEARRDDPERSWKLTDEDWRNRDKYPQYCEAIDDMFAMTSTDFCPWRIVESDDKRYARVKVLSTINEAIEARLAQG